MNLTAWIIGAPFGLNCFPLPGPNTVNGMTHGIRGRVTAKTPPAVDEHSAWGMVPTIWFRRIAAISFVIYGVLLGSTPASARQT